VSAPGSVHASGGENPLILAGRRSGLDGFGGDRIGRAGAQRRITTPRRRPLSRMSRLPVKWLRSVLALMSV